MPILREWDLQLSPDQVLRGQGAEPEIIRQRSPHLVEIAERALVEGAPLLKPAALFRRIQVHSITHERVRLEDGSELRGKLVAQHLAPAKEALIVLCTIGSDLERHVSDVLPEDMVYALALDGLGSAGVEALANAVCSYFEQGALASGFETSIPLSPGMTDWSVDEGQPQIFALLDSQQIGVQLLPSKVMLPKKSLSMVIGIGPKMIAGSTCDHCHLRETCRYRAHYD